jgi:hypothetical protein
MFSPLCSQCVQPSPCHSKDNQIRLRYIYTHDWRKLAAIVTSSIAPTPLDEMITLADENKTAPRHFRGVRVVKFRDVDHICRQLTMAAGPASTLNPTATPFVPVQATSQATAEPSIEATSDEAEDSVIQVDEEEEESETPEETDVAAIMESIGTNFTGLSADALAEQHSAAMTLQSYYRRLLANRKRRITNSILELPKTRRTQFEEFARVAESIEWPPKSLYRPIYLGALPHLLTCLAYTRSVVMEEKQKVKRQERKNEKHEGIEGLMEQRTKLKYVLIRIGLMKT